MRAPRDSPAPSRPSSNDPEPPNQGQTTFFLDRPRKTKTWSVPDFSLWSRRVSALFGRQLSVLNAGIASFADAIVQRGGAATRLEWAPPAGGDRELGMALARLVNHPAIEAANAKAAERYLAAQPRLEGIGVAREVLPGMGERMILHAGPPIAWKRMCGPMRGAIIGAILYEGWAKDADAA